MKENKMKKEMDKTFEKLKKFAGYRACSLSVEKKSWEDGYVYSAYVADSVNDKNDYFIKSSYTSFQDAFDKILEECYLRKNKK